MANLALAPINPKTTKSIIQSIRSSIHIWLFFSVVILTSRFEATPVLFWDGPVILNFCQMTMPELALPLHTSEPHQREVVWPPTYDLTYNRPNTRRIFRGIRFRTLWPQCRDLTTRPSPPSTFGWK
ncbi:hypothetical protein AVEN_16436-1 [Araneus ventricosus]|uniref:Uncharacterized protein n=1 Tax=Araneus ventricosus TaxID=182803 RepID=A0A4Y2HSK0_ARAVE|nr:hypothetical protein AVEN_16436-1 [Araneus ventricosus]